MRIVSKVVSISWIPMEAISGMPKLPFEAGITHYDQPPPDVIDDLEALRKADAFREANELAAKSGVIDFKKWYRESYGTHTPWGNVETAALVSGDAISETALAEVSKTRP